MFVLVLVLSFGLRFAKVIFDRQPVFGDEAIYVRWSQVMRNEPSLRFMPQSDGKQPLYMWTTIPFLKIFDDPLIASRMLSVYTGVVTTAGVFFLAFLLFNSINTALFAGFVHAVSPYSVFFDSMALADPMLSMFGVWTFIFAVITVKKKRLDTAMLSGFALGGAFLTKSPATFFALFLPFTLLLHEWPKKNKMKIKDLLIFVFIFSFTYAIAFAMYNILRLGENFHMIGMRNQDYVYTFSHLLESPLNPLIPFIKMVLEYFWFMGPSLLLILISVGIMQGLGKIRKETALLLLWGILPIFAVAEFSKTMTARYVYFSLPYIFILASLSSNRLKKFNEIKSAGIFQKLIFLSMAIFVIHSFYLDYKLICNPQSVNLPRSERSGYFEEWTSGYGIKEAANYIINYQKENPDEKIVIGTEGYFGTLPDGLQIYLNAQPEITVIGVGIDMKEVPQSLRESVAFGNKTYLLINNSRLKTDYNKLDLKLISLYPKALRKEGTIEYNLNGPQEVLYLFEVNPPKKT